MQGGKQSRRAEWQGSHVSLNPMALAQCRAQGVERLAAAQLVLTCCPRPVRILQSIQLQHTSSAILPAAPPHLPPPGHVHTLGYAGPALDPASSGNHFAQNTGPLAPHFEQRLLLVQVSPMLQRWSTFQIGPQTRWHALLLHARLRLLLNSLVCGVQGGTAGTCHPNIRAPNM